MSFTYEDIATKYSESLAYQNRQKTDEAKRIFVIPLACRNLSDSRNLSADAHISILINGVDQLHDGRSAESSFPLTCVG